MESCLKNSCEICNSGDIAIEYNGKIRYGKFGDYIENSNIYVCKNCGVKFYNSGEIDYKNDDYRTLVQEDTSAQKYYHNQDDEQIHNLEVVGIHNLRDKVVADIGCGAGSFLDCIKGVAKDIIAIEPYVEYQKVLNSKGYKVYDYSSSISNDTRIDIATSFAVIEHVDNPVEFLGSIKSKMADKGGVMVISTPNADDFQLELIGDEYKNFYYRYVHKWYFNQQSLKFIADKLGFKKVEFKYVHKYDMSNLIYWLKDKRPTGLSKTEVLSELTLPLKAVVEKNGISNFLYAKFYV